MSVVLYFQVEERHAADAGWWHLARLFLPEDPLLYALLAGLRASEWPGPPLEFIPRIAQISVEYELQGCTRRQDYFRAA